MNQIMTLIAMMMTMTMVVTEVAAVTVTMNHSKMKTEVLQIRMKTVHLRNQFNQKRDIRQKIQDRTTDGPNKKKISYLHSLRLNNS